MDIHEMLVDDLQEDMDLPEGFDLFAEEPEQKEDREDLWEEPEEDTNPTELLEQGEQGKEPRMVTLKYNGQEVEKSLDEVLKLAQKGMNYDHVKGKLDAAAKNAPAARLLERYARQMGMDMEEFLQRAESELNMQAVQELTGRGLPEAEARELLEYRAQKAEAAGKAPAEKERKLWLDFVEKYPDVAESGNIELEVARNIQAGMTPVQAQMVWENDQLKQQLAALKAGQNNRSAAPGSAAGTAGNFREDSFLKAFLAD